MRVVYMVLWSMMAVSGWALPIPPKAEWKAGASGFEKPDQYRAEEAIDGNRETRWSSPNSQPNQLEIDLGREADLFGCTILWERAFASAYNVETSLDGKTWTRVYETEDGDGSEDEVFFRRARARYVRINATERGTPHWGFSIYEVDLKGADEQVLVTVEGQSPEEASALMDGSYESVWRSPKAGSCVIDLDLRSEKELGGIWIRWGDGCAVRGTLLTSQDRVTWAPAARLADGTGGKDLLLHEGRKARYVRIQIDETEGGRPAEIQDLSFCSPGEYDNSLLKYNFTAKKHRRGIYPLQFLKEQVYWTLMGVPGGREESLVDELGNFEPRRKAGSLQPYLEVGGELVSGADAPVLEHRMEEGCLPLPFVGWDMQPVSVEIRGMAHGAESNTASYMQYTLKNGSDQVQTGRFYLVVRPVQVNPWWQFGGISPIERLAYREIPEGLGVFVNDRLEYVALTPPSGMAARGFEQGDIVEDLLRGRFPACEGLDQAGKEISGALAYDYELAPGEAQAIVIAAPLYDSAKDIRRFARAMEVEAVDAGVVFDRLFGQVAGQWRRLLGRVTIELPEEELSDNT